LHRCVIHFHEGSEVEEVQKIIEDNGGKILPSPIISPPIQISEVPEGIIAKLKKVKGVREVLDQGDTEDVFT
ncbi:hypothetical protein BGZ46_006697, partial [Entomortierella lignicola]